MTIEEEVSQLRQTVAKWGAALLESGRITPNDYRGALDGRIVGDVLPDVYQQELRAGHIKLLTDEQWADYDESVRQLEPKPRRKPPQPKPPGKPVCRHDAGMCIYRETPDEKASRERRQQERAEEIVRLTPGQKKFLQKIRGRRARWDFC